MLFSSCILVTLKFAAGRQTCCPSCAELGLKDWAIAMISLKTLLTLAGFEPWKDEKKFNLTFI
jgi:hypothetical protein